MTEPNNSRVPVPDPTLATIRASETALTAHDQVVAAQFDVVSARIEGVERESAARRDGLRTTIDQRFTDIYKAHDLLAAEMRNVPTELRIAITGLKELADVKVQAIQGAAVDTKSAIDGRFDLLDKQTVREKAAADLALAAAFDAQKEAAAAQNNANAEAIRKSEAATAEKIQKNDEAMRTGQSATNDKIEDLKDRLVRAESLIIALQTQRASSHETKGDNRTVITVGVGIAALFVSIIVAAVTIYAMLKT